MYLKMESGGRALLGYEMVGGGRWRWQTGMDGVG